MRLNELEEYIQGIPKNRVIVIIDGRCGSGKSTLGARLAADLDGTLLHCDDFYLQGYQRTPERLSEVGGNLDYERFKKEVIDPLKDNHAILYRTFDHETLAPKAGYVIHPKRFVIIEGSYSSHPYFGDYYDVGIFSDIDQKTQMENIIKREGRAKATDFKKKWIPKEEAYFKKFHIEEGKWVYHYVSDDYGVFERSGE